MSDLVVTVRQIANYPNSGVLPSDTLLMQRGGLGGPYVTTSAAELVSAALMGPPVPLSLSVGVPVPGNDTGGGVFSTYYSSLPGGGLRINNYDSAPGVQSYLTTGAAAVVGQDGTGELVVLLAGQGAAQAPVTAFSEVLTLNLAGAMSLPYGTLTVARDPAAANEVATLNWVSNNTVASFNGRIGRVQLTQGDVYGALQLDSAIATQNWSIGAINAAIGDFVSTYPLVTCWNGRTGNVYLTLSDITCVFYQPGQQPISPTPLLTSNDDSIATTKWVTEYIANEFAGGGGNLATQTWVLANTVNSFNGRRGVVTLTQADVLDVGAAPLNNPNFSGVPTAPTAAQGQATGQIATTAFVQQAISANTAGVSTFNTRSGDVVLTNADIVAAGGLANPSAGLTGNPTAPTQPPGTNLPVIATCEFVTRAVAAGVVSFNTRTGAVVLTLADITGVGGAPIVSPAFSSVPTAPTAAPGTNTVQLATCAFVTQALNVAGGVSSFNGRTGAVDLIGNDISAAGGLVNPSVTLTGTPTAPTAPANTNSQQIATTAFVATALSSGTVTSFNTRTGAITLTGADITNAGGAVLASPAFTGAPTAPTAAANTNNTQLATTQFVMAAILADTTGVTSFNTRTGAVSLTAADLTGAGGALSASPQFTGIPQAPTATAGTNTTQLATTQFVQSAIASSGVSSFNARTGAVTLIANDISAAGGALLASPTFTGTPAAPTAATATNTTQLATTAFVHAAITALGGPFLALTGGTLSGALSGTTGNFAGTLTAGSLLTVPSLNVTSVMAANSGNVTITPTLVPNGGINQANVWSVGSGGLNCQVAATFQAIHCTTVTATGNISMNAMSFGDGHTQQFFVDTSQGGPFLTFNLDGASQGYLIRSQASGVTYLAQFQQMIDNTGSALYVWWTAGGVAYAVLQTPSDRRFKSNIANATVDALALVNALNVYECDVKPPWTDAPVRHWDCALMADEIETAIPAAFIKGTDDSYDSISELPVVATLVRAIQQMTGQSNTLRERIEALEARMTEAGA